eukprot:TRINITY_DN4116_c0_g1_i1.p1 TRINITY_DN4116_c0_g1~~TRINITY_DN4116_c0_g1_i1.p1  ORF type:complete len:811 (-),score=100.07 TRINITY_DN4116_c0_g1_i1:47-2479(-)
MVVRQRQHLWWQRWASLLVLCLLLCTLGPACIASRGPSPSPASAPPNLTQADVTALKLKVKEMYLHAFEGYMVNAFPADELRPISCTGRSGKEDRRGHVDDCLGNFMLTLVDSLESLLVIGEEDRFESAVKVVVRDLSFDLDETVSVFESTIRMLGGLLSAHLLIIEKDLFSTWYRGELLLLSLDLGERLLPAFNTPTGLPYQKVNLRKGVLPSEPNHTCTACAGTLQLEFGLLSSLTGDDRFSDASKRALDALWSRRSEKGLLPNSIFLDSGDWKDRDAYIGAGIDSFYEYLLKSYVYFGDPEYFIKFAEAYQGVESFMKVNGWYVPVDYITGRPRYFYVDSLSAFWPGLQVMIGDIDAARVFHGRLFSLWKRYDALPERFDLVGLAPVHGMSGYPLRPELAESTYLLYRATRDPHYLEVGQVLLQSLEKFRTQCGFAALSHVETHRTEERMDSYFLSETLKYLYLLFDEDNFLHQGNYVFTTEGHPLPMNQPFHRTPPSWNSRVARLPLKCPRRMPSSSRFELSTPDTRAPPQCLPTDGDALSLELHLSGVNPTEIAELQLAILPVEAEVIINSTIYAIAATFSSSIVDQIDAPVKVPEDPHACHQYPPDRFAGFIMLVRRGGCTFLEKARNMKDSGAVAIIIFDDKQGPLFQMTDGTPDGSVVPTLDFPVLMISLADGLRLVESMPIEETAIVETTAEAFCDVRPPTISLCPKNELPPSAYLSSSPPLLSHFYLSLYIQLKPSHPDMSAQFPLRVVSSPNSEPHTFITDSTLTFSLPARGLYLLAGATANFTFNPSGLPALTLQENS